MGTDTIRQARASFDACHFKDQAARVISKNPQDAGDIDRQDHQYLREECEDIARVPISVGYRACDCVRDGAQCDLCSALPQNLRYTQNVAHIPGPEDDVNKRNRNGCSPGYSIDADRLDEHDTEPQIQDRLKYGPSCEWRVLVDSPS